MLANVHFMKDLYPQNHKFISVSDSYVIGTILWFSHFLLLLPASLKMQGPKSHSQSVLAKGIYCLLSLRCKCVRICNVEFKMAQFNKRANTLILNNSGVVKCFLQYLNISPGLCTFKLLGILTLYDLSKKVVQILILVKNKLIFARTSVCLLTNNAFL